MAKNSYNRKEQSSSNNNSNRNGYFINGTSTLTPKKGLPMKAGFSIAIPETDNLYAGLSAIYASADDTEKFLGSLPVRIILTDLSTTQEETDLSDFIDLTEAETDLLYDNKEAPEEFEPKAYIRGVIQLGKITGAANKRTIKKPTGEIKFSSAINKKGNRKLFTLLDQLVQLGDENKIKVMLGYINSKLEFNSIIPFSGEPKVEVSVSDLI